MEHIGQELRNTASSHVRRVRRTSGRLVVSALGFGLAYYFDAENGGERRAQLRRSLRHAAAIIDGAMAHQVDDAPAVFTPLFEAFRSERAERGYDPRLAQLAQRAESN